MPLEKNPASPQAQIEKLANPLRPTTLHTTAHNTDYIGPLGRSNRMAKKPSSEPSEIRSEKPAVELVPQPHGGALQRGNPGNSGGQGRPPDAWKALCRELVSRDSQLEVAREVLEDKNHPAWLGAYKFLTEQGYGKPTETIHQQNTQVVVILRREA